MGKRRFSELTAQPALPTHTRRRGWSLRDSQEGLVSVCSREEDWIE